MSAELSKVGIPSLTDLANRFGSDKGTNPGDWGLAHGYAAIYERFLSVRRFEPLRLLELGVWKGGSLRMWESYLPNAQIIGIENLPNVVQEPSKRSEILIGDAANEQFLSDTLHRFSGGKVDIVIDDASHILDQQVRTFETLFPFVEDGGLYFVEDVSGSRFKDGNRGLLPFLDFLDYSWNLAQETTFFSDDNTSTYHHISDVRSLSRAEKDQIRVSFWNRHLGSVHYFHDLCVFEKLDWPREIEHLKQTDRLRPSPGISYQLRQSGSPRDSFGIDDLNLDELRLKFESTVELFSDHWNTLVPLGEVSQKNGAGTENEAGGGKAKWLIDQARAFAGQLTQFLNEFKARKHSMQRLESLANASESERVRISQEFAVLQSTNATLSAEVARLNDQVEAARGKLQNVWDFIFRLQAEQVAESAQLKAELATLSQQVPKLQAALVNLKCQNNALRLENADWKQTGERLSSALAKRKAETIQLAQERDEVRLQMARRLSSKVWLFKRLFHF
jgi:regulator of replication initiation timing